MKYFEKFGKLPHKNMKIKRLFCFVFLIKKKEIKRVLKTNERVCFQI